MGIAIGFGIVIFSSYWREIGVVQWQVNPLTFLASLFVLVSALSGWAWVWAWLVQQLGAPNASLFRLAAMMIQSNMTKYLPGALWNYFARSYFGHSEAVGQKSIWLANLLEIIAAIGTGFLLYGASLLWPHRHEPIVPAATAIFLGLLSFACGSPSALALVFRAAGTLPRLSHLNSWPSLSWADYFLLLVSSLLTWLWVGGGFWLLVLSVYPAQNFHAVELVGGWLFSFVAGLLAIGVPQGIGVRDGILVLFLSASMPLPAAIALATLSRLWLIIGDFVTPLVWAVGRQGFVSLRRTSHTFSDPSRHV
jgi:hypothetical protein